MGGSYNNRDVESTLLVENFETIVKLCKTKILTLAQRTGDSICFGFDHNGNNSLAIHFLHIKVMKSLEKQLVVLHTLIVIWPKKL
jgi:hypothetical protein